MVFFRFSSHFMISCSFLILFSFSCKKAQLSRVRALPEIESFDCSTLAVTSDLRRLTNEEYINSVTDIIGYDFSQLKSTLPSEDASEGFRNSSLHFLMSSEHIKKYEELAGAIAETSISMKPFINKFIGSCLEGIECERSFITKFGRMIFRRPLTEEEKNSFYRLLESVKKTEKSFFDGVEAVIKAMLQSPQFLYKIERSPENGRSVKKISNYELATRMAYFVWHSAPDESLLDLAEQEKLSSPEEIRKEVRRMLADEKGLRAFRQYAAEWLNLDQLFTLQRSPETFPEFNPKLAEDMRLEVLQFLSDYVYEQNRSMVSAYLAPYSYLTSELASFYKINTAIRSSFPEKYNFGPKDHRTGLLTMAGVLSGLSSGDDSAPISRGLFMARKVLCQDVPPPPASAAAAALASGAHKAKTPKEKFALHAQPTCASCHRYMDPFGLGLENYDSLGRYREVYENGEPVVIDEKYSINEDNQRFNSPDGLASAVRSSKVAYACYINNTLQYAYGRKIPIKSSCELKRLVNLSKGSEIGYRSLIEEIVLTDNFIRLRSQ